MPRVEAVSARRVQPIPQSQRIEEARARAVIAQRSQAVAKEVTRRAAQDVVRRPSAGPGAKLDVQG